MTHSPLRRPHSLRAAVAVVGALALGLVAAPAHAGFKVSSYKVDSRSTGASAHDAAAALDGNAATAWQINPEEQNPGSWIEVDVPQGTVDKVSVVVGWNDTKLGTWEDYARLKEVRVEIYDGAADDPSKPVHESVHTLEDVVMRQMIDLPDTKVGDPEGIAGGKVRLVVQSVYEGKDFAHLAVGEYLVHMGEFEAAIRDLEAADGIEAAEGHPAEHMVDDSTRTYWVAPSLEDATFSMSGGRYSVSSIGLTAGPSSMGRPSTIEVSQGNVTRTYEMPNDSKTHWFELPALVGYTGSGFGSVTVTIKDVHGDEKKPPALADVKFRATMLDPF